MAKHTTDSHRDTAGMLPTVRYAVDPGWFHACWWDARPTAKSRFFAYSRRLRGLSVGTVKLIGRSTPWNRSLNPQGRFAHPTVQM